MCYLVLFDGVRERGRRASFGGFTFGPYFGAITRPGRCFCTMAILGFSKSFPPGESIRLWTLSNHEVRRRPVAGSRTSPCREEVRE